MNNKRGLEWIQTLLGLLLGAVLLLQPLSSRAADLYQIELIVFSRPGGAQDEHSVTGAGLHYPTRLATLQTAPADASLVGPWQLLPATVRLLNNEEAALARRGFPILFHGAWRQPVDTATRATAVMISGGRATGAHHELEGSVTLSAENYLHASINLWLSQFGSTPGSAEAIVLPVPDGIVDGGIDATGVHVDKLFVLQQNRKLRSGELHYFDHPRFSALVLVKPVES